MPRVARCLFVAIDGPELVVWVPAHTTDEDAGAKRRGDGSTLTKHAVERGTKVLEGLRAAINNYRKLHQ